MSEAFVPAPIHEPLAEGTPEVKKSPSQDWNFLGSMESWEKQFHKGVRPRVVEITPLRKDQLYAFPLGTMDGGWRDQVKKIVPIFDPTVEGRAYDAKIDAPRESKALLDAAFPILGINPNKLGLGSTMELGIAALLAVATDRYLTAWVTPINPEIVAGGRLEDAQRLRDLTDIDLALMQTVYEKAKIQRVSSFEEAAPVIDQVIKDVTERSDRSVKTKEVREFFSNTQNSPIRHQVNIHGASKDVHNLDETTTFLGEQNIEYANWIVDLPAGQWSANNYELYRKELQDRGESFANFTYCQPYSYGSIKDAGIDVFLAATRGKYAVIYMPEATPEQDPDGSYSRGRGIFISHMNALTELMPWLSDYVRVTDSLDEAHQYMRTIMEFAPQPEFDLPAETSFAQRTPEKFRSDGDILYTPDRITKSRIRKEGKLEEVDSKRTEDFQDLLRKITYVRPQEIKTQVNETEVRQRLFDLVVANAAGRLFPVPNTAADVIPVATGWTQEQMEAIKAQGYNPDNCIVLGIGRKDRKLRVIGGFNDFGEELAFTGRREIREEIHGDIQNLVPMPPFSRPTRDERFVVVSGVFGATVDMSTLSPSDEVEQVIIVPLIDKNGNFNKSFTIANQEMTDVTGQTFTHEGVRADHKELMRSMYNYWINYWVDNQTGPNTTLRQAIEGMAAVFPQELMAGEVHEEEPEQTFTLPVTQLDGQVKNLRVTDNILFVIQNAADIFAKAGYPDALERAVQFAQKAVEIDVLPPYPQAAVAADAFILKGDNLVVQEFPRKDGTKEFRLLGTYYGPERDESESDLKSLIEGAAKGKAKLHFTAHAFLGVTGSRRAVDPRYPRNTFVYAGSVTGEELPQAVLADGSILREIPIWNEDKTGFSAQLLEAQWGFGHKDLLPLLERTLQKYDPHHTETAQEVIDSRR